MNWNTGKRPSVSVAMAAYGGSAYIKQQIDSIVDQLQEEDELVISVDPGPDDTDTIVQNYAVQDPRVVYLQGSGKGIAANFENAIRHTRNEIVFLSDQDDIWKKDKVQKVLACFEKKECMAVLHDASIIDENGNRISDSFFKQHGSKEGFTSNLIRNSWIGCCMAFRKELKDVILPFPSPLPMHDQWIGLAAQCIEHETGLCKTADSLAFADRKSRSKSALKNAQSKASVQIGRTLFACKTKNLHLREGKRKAVLLNFY
jgi:glycosyltransferase involved in cell wall biosynthesis